jgi:hypothetical protein
MDDQQSRLTDALAALREIIPRLKGFNWVITGGFACYVYGVERAITDIDIDIDTSKDDPQFLSLLAEMQPFISQSLEHYVDQNYDNYCFEAVIQEQLLDVCPMAELKIFNQQSHVYEPLYPNGFPKIELTNFCGLELPLLAKELIIRNKQMLVWQRDWTSPVFTDTNLE